MAGPACFRRLGAQVARQLKAIAAAENASAGLIVDNIRGELSHNVHTCRLLATGASVASPDAGFANLANHHGLPEDLGPPDRGTSSEGGTSELIKQASESAKSLREIVEAGFGRADVDGHQTESSSSEPSGASEGVGIRREPGHAATSSGTAGQRAQFEGVRVPHIVWPPKARHSSPPLRALKTEPPEVTAVPGSVQELIRSLNRAWAQQHFDEMVALFDKFRENSEQTPNEQAFNLVILAQDSLMDDVASVFARFDEMRSAGLKPTVLTYSTLLRTAYRVEDARLAHQVLRLMDEAGVKPDRECYNTALITFALAKSAETAMEFFRRMLKDGLKPGRQAYHELLLSCARMKTKRTNYAVEIMKHMLSERIDVPPRIYQEVVLAGVIRNDVDCVQLALTELTQTRETLDQGSTLAVLNCAARNGALPLLRLAWQHNVAICGQTSPLPEAHLARIHGLAGAGDLDSAFLALGELEAAHIGNKSSLPAEEQVEILAPHASLAPLVGTLSRGVAVLDEAYYKLAALNTTNRRVPLSAINCVIMGCSNARDMDRAFQTFDEIERTFKLKPDVHTFTALMHGCNRTNQVAAAVQAFDTIKSSGLQPDHRAYSLLIEAYVMARDPDNALKSLTKMQNAGFVPYRQTVIQVLRRCKREQHKEGTIEMQKLISELGYSSDENAAHRREIIRDTFLDWKRSPQRKWNMRAPRRSQESNRRKPLFRESDQEY